jgi:hypothetical protein
VPIFSKEQGTRNNLLIFKISALILIGIFSNSCNYSSRTNDEIVISTQDELINLLPINPNNKILKERNNSNQLNNTCIPSIDNPNYRCIGFTFNEPITIPAIYPCYIECTTNILYQISVCRDNTTNEIVSVNLYNLSFDNFTDVNCENQIYNCLGNDDYLISLYCYNVIKALSFIIENKYAQNVSNYIPPCASGKTISFNFYKEQCFSVCINHSTIVPKWFVGTCGDRCCVRTRTVCKLPSGEFEFGSPTYSTNGTIQCNSNSYIFGCDLTQPCFEYPCGS